MELGNLMTLRQCARLLHVRDSQVRTWITSGELAVIDLGTAGRKNWRIDPADVRVFLDRRKPPVPTPVSSGRRKSKADNRKTWF